MDQSQALEFIRMKKKFKEKSFIFPQQNQSIKLEALGNNENDLFLIDINRKRAILSRCTFQKRIHTHIGLIRLDIDTKPHKNPDDEIIDGNHIHIYKEGYGLSWAYPLDISILKKINPNLNCNIFSDLSNHNLTFTSFCKLCNLNTPIFNTSF